MYLDGNFVVAALGALVCIPAAKGLMDIIYPYFVSNVAAGLELSFPPQLYAVIYAGVLACWRATCSSTWCWCAGSTA